MASYLYQRETQRSSNGILPRVADSIFQDDNRYAKNDICSLAIKTALEIMTGWESSPKGQPSMTDISKVMPSIQRLFYYASGIEF